MFLITKNKDGTYSNNKWLIYKKLNWWYCYCKQDGEYSDYTGMFPTLWQAKQNAQKLDKIGYGS